MLNKQFAATLAFLLIIANVAVAKPIDISHTITPRKQDKKWSCWAAATAVLWEWKNHKIITEADLADLAGEKFRAIYDAGATAGITEAQEGVFYKSLGLRVERGQNPSIDAWAGMLESGPLSVTLSAEKKGEYHAIVVYAFRGDGSAQNTTVTFLDPWDGKSYELQFAKFVDLFEKGSGYEIQIIHW